MEAAKLQINHSQNKPTSKNDNRQHREIQYPKFINDFSEYLIKHNYADSTIQNNKKKAKKFVEELNVDIQIIEDFRKLTLDQIKIYENLLIQRLKNKEIKIGSAYAYIRNAKLFLQFLRHKNLITFNYSIPRMLMVKKASRTNTYITNEQIQYLIDYLINDTSQNKYRNLTIVLILIDTGCRPIEISNLRIRDLKLSERQIVFYSVKSGKRVVAINNTLVKVLRRYLGERKEVKIKTDALFLKGRDNPITPSFIATLMCEINYKVFQKCIINAKSLRHTYVTNAIENKNELIEVSRAVGHKLQVSTLYYLHKSVERLLSNTMEYDPINNIFKDDNQWQ